MDFRESTESELFNIEKKKLIFFYLDVESREWEELPDHRDLPARLAFKDRPEFKDVNFCLMDRQDRPAKRDRKDHPDFRDVKEFLEIQHPEIRARKAIPVVQGATDTRVSKDRTEETDQKVDFFLGFKDLK